MPGTDGREGRPALWFASGNAHKRAELSRILAGRGLSVRLLGPEDGVPGFDPEETENSFVGNALLKAGALHALLCKERPPLYREGQPILADDSGLCVDALDGRPGILSARYAGPETGSGSAGRKLDSGRRNELLLAELGDNPLRRARFVCAVALFFAPEDFFVFQQTFEGEIVLPGKAAGNAGFGYDPIFFLPELGRTAAELSEAEKDRLSHRGKALRYAAPVLKERLSIIQG